MRIVDYLHRNARKIQARAIADTYDEMDHAHNRKTYEAKRAQVLEIPKMTLRQVLTKYNPPYHFIIEEAVRRNIQVTTPLADGSHDHRLKVIK